ncbi:MAG TPA: response regulator [Candidatus Omnitrophota bacterium]|nr:response regulator [Candidatus Omnitrophota bacterium]
MEWHILSVDDEPDVGRQIKDLLDGRIKKNGDELIVDVVQDFDVAMRNLDTMLYDLLILDVFKGKPSVGNTDRPGEGILQEIKKRCFIPVVFYTALPQKVSQYESSLVRIVHKTSGGAAKLKAEIVALIKTGLPKINRQLIEHFSAVEAKYMWEFVEPYWQKFDKASDSKSLAYLLARRLASSFSRTNIHNLVNSFGGTTEQPCDPDEVHPIEHYIWPAVGEQYATGDILSRKEKGAVSYYIILTPSCDLVQDEKRTTRNAEKVLIAGCFSLASAAEVKEWQKYNDETTSKAKDAKENLKRIIMNRKKDRYYFLPGTFFLPDLIVDMESVLTIECSKLQSFHKAATLDSPFAECLLNRFSRYMGRVGIPELYEEEIERIIGSTKKGGEQKK